MAFTYLNMRTVEFWEAIYVVSVVGLSTETFDLTPVLLKITQVLRQR